MHTETLIIGGGISGLSTAHFLSKKTSDFLILESSNNIGGIIQSKSIKNFICENGPNTVLLNNDATLDIIKDLGIWNDLIYPELESNKLRYVFKNDNLTKIPNSFLEFLASDLISLKSKILLFSEIFKKKHTKNTTVYNFIKKRFGKEIHDQLFEPFLTGIYAGDTHKMSVKHTLKKIWSIEQKFGSVIKGLFSEKTKRIKSFSFPHGLQYMINKLNHSLKDNILLKSEVNKIFKEKDGYHVLVNNEYKIHCKNIVSAVPSYVLQKLIDDKPLIDHLNALKYNPIDVFHFGFRNENIKNKIDGFGVLTKAKDKKNYLGILFNSSIFNHLSEKNTSLFTVLVGGERQKSLCKMEIAKLKKIILKETEELIHHEGDVVMSNHYRWGNGIPQYNLNQEQLSSSINSFMSKNDGFYIIGNYFNGISVSDCIDKGKGISQRI